MYICVCLKWRGKPQRWQQRAVKIRLHKCQWNQRADGRVSLLPFPAFWNSVCSLQVWLEDDVELYDFAKVRPFIKKKQVKVGPSFNSKAWQHQHPPQRNVGWFWLVAVCSTAGTSWTCRIQAPNIQQVPGTVPAWSSVGPNTVPLVWDLNQHLTWSSSTFQPVELRFNWNGLKLHTFTQHVHVGLEVWSSNKCEMNCKYNSEEKYVQ